MHIGKKFLTVTAGIKKNILIKPFYYTGESPARPELRRERDIIEDDGDTANSGVFFFSIRESDGAEHHEQ
ncbi:hypothetical protein DAMNIGENAA_07740 [Desulforhabdus amnigena]|uniref:Uncharacterized protein n=1 Tax=Desulforhabdus amnigena TaxID=40218 RepID=A0A9W6D509_9BACT|nr:hypothetical protein DAMNIGENAA_07740 [Desulforhabdus amnigena]